MAAPAKWSGESRLAAQLATGSHVGAGSSTATRPRVRDSLGGVALVRVLAYQWRTASTPLPGEASSGRDRPAKIVTHPPSDAAMGVQLFWPPNPAAAVSRNRSATRPSRT